MQFITYARSRDKNLTRISLILTLEAQTACNMQLSMQFITHAQSVGRILRPLALTLEAQTAFNCPFINHSSVHIQNTKLKNLKNFTIPTAIILSW